MSTRIFSPSLMKGGTCTTSPVSVLAGLVTLEAVARTCRERNVILSGEESSLRELSRESKDP